MFYLTDSKNRALSNSYSPYLYSLITLNLRINHLPTRNMSKPQIKKQARHKGNAGKA